MYIDSPLPISVTHRLRHRKTASDLRKTLNSYQQTRSFRCKTSIGPRRDIYRHQEGLSLLNITSCKNPFEAYKEIHKFRYTPGSRDERTRLLTISRFHATPSQKNRKRPQSKQVPVNTTIQKFDTLCDFKFIRRKSLENKWNSTNTQLRLLQGQQRVRLSFLNSIVKENKITSPRSQQELIKSLLTVVKPPGQRPTAPQSSKKKVEKQRRLQQLQQVQSTEIGQAANKPYLFKSKRRQSNNATQDRTIFSSQQKRHRTASIYTPWVGDDQQNILLF